MSNKGRVKMTFYTESDMVIGWLIAPFNVLTPFPTVRKDTKWCKIEMLEEVGF